MTTNHESLQPIKIRNICMIANGRVECCCQLNGRWRGELRVSICILDIYLFVVVNFHTINAKLISNVDHS